MKKAYSILVVLILIGISALGQIPTNGLVGYWPFNGNPDDVSGKSNSGSISIQSPNGGEIWTAPYLHAIIWSSTGISFANIDYTVDNGNNWFRIYTNINASGYDTTVWTLPCSPSTQCKVRITDANNPSTYDESDNVFTILANPSLFITVISPNGNENLQVGVSYLVTWSTINITNVSLHYSIDNGISWLPIEYYIPASLGFYYWNVPPTPSNKCFLKISEASNHRLYDNSDSPFAINFATGTTDFSERFQVYPNPSGGQFEVKSSEAIQTITVYNLMGEILEKFHVKNSETSLDLSHRGVGIYYLKINFQNRFKIQKVVVM